MLKHLLFEMEFLGLGFEAPPSCKGFVQTLKSDSVLGVGIDSSTILVNCSVQN